MVWNDLDQLTTVANDDETLIIDRSDTTESANGTSKRITRENLLKYGMKILNAFSSFTTSNWSKAIEMPEGFAIQWLKSSSAYSRGIGYTSDGNLYFFRSTANDNSAAPIYDMILYSSGWLGLDKLDVTSEIGSPWTNLSLNTGWINYGASYQTTQYKKFGDFVIIRGLIARTSGTEAVIATLPSGYRPSLKQLYTVATNTGYGEIEITTAGSIVLRSGGVGYLSFGEITFSLI